MYRSNLLSNPFPCFIFCINSFSNIVKDISHHFCIKGFEFGTQGYCKLWLLRQCFILGITGKDMLKLLQVSVLLLSYNMTFNNLMFSAAGCSWKVILYFEDVYLGLLTLLNSDLIGRLIFEWNHCDKKKARVSWWYALIWKSVKCVVSKISSN